MCCLRLNLAFHEIEILTSFCGFPENGTFNPVVRKLYISKSYSFDILWKGLQTDLDVPAPTLPTLPNNPSPQPPLRQARLPLTLLAV